jgi:imidazolonepropionase-like amidohydrolase
MRVIAVPCLLLLGHIGTLRAQGAAQLSELTRGFVTANAPVVVLRHVRVIDGTGSAPVGNQVIIISNGTIAYVGDSARASVPPNAQVLDLAGHTVVPGFVGLHDHMYYSPLGERRTSMTESGPRLYLAGGVTTIRTAGAFFPYDELALKHAIDHGEIPGPNIHVSVSIGSTPSRNGFDGTTAGNRPVATTPEQARRIVDYWVEEGVTWFGEGLPATRELMGAVIEQAHKRGARVTGHICSVTHREAVALGIDNLEHGLINNSDFLPDKPPDVCPQNAQRSQLAVDVHGDAVRATFRDMLARNVGLTSTLSVYELFVPTRPPSPALEARILDVLAPEVVPAYHRWREAVKTGNGAVSIVEPELFQKMMQYDREFFRAGGLLAAGVDVWGNGSLPGFGNQRNYEIFVEAGLTPAEAIKVMSANGARVLGGFERFGSITVGKRADLAVINGDPATRPSDIYNVTLVFKDGVGYDSAKLIASVRGLVGIR